MKAANVYFCSICLGRLLCHTRKVNGADVIVRVECVWCGMTPVSIADAAHGTTEVWTRVAPATVLRETFWETRAANVYARSLGVAVGERESEAAE